ncbi:MAG: aliphatic sulfonate ABC transporter permease SsuC [Aphanocapsa lilacina HA4352-LM1]|nr:aliphatic sulfonate ABC transporter permease SsuC [Aphanocapsa lilacina HA4352-LM1]
MAWLVPVALLVLWQWTAQSGFLASRILPAPLAVIEAAFDLARKGELLQHIGVSFARAVCGFLVGGGIAFALGLLNGVSRTSETLLDTTVQMIRNIPHLALIPLVILWFGIGEEAKVFLVALGVFFPIYINTYHGMRTVDPGVIEMGRVYGLGPAALFWQILLPGALPSILIGVRFALGVMWLTLIVAETIASDAGIGYMAMNAREFMQTDVVVFSVLLYALLGKLADATARLAERRWLQWHPNYAHGREGA